MFTDIPYSDLQFVAVPLAPFQKTDADAKKKAAADAKKKAADANK